jgi:hypothetical protein
MITARRVGPHGLQFDAIRSASRCGNRAIWPRVRPFLPLAAGFRVPRSVASPDFKPVASKTESDPIQYYVGSHLKYRSVRASCKSLLLWYAFEFLGHRGVNTTRRVPT